MKNKKNTFFKNLIIIMLPLMLNACNNLEAVYKNKSDSHQFLSDINLAPIDSIEGADFYNHLKNILPPQKSSKYRLTCSIVQAGGFSILHSNSDILRKNITITVSYTLKDDSGKTIESSSFSRISSYNSSGSPYSTNAQGQAAKTNLTIAAAEEVRSRLILYFKHKNI